MTQAEACEAALRELNRTSSLEEIAAVINNRGYPVKKAPAKNYGPVMSCDKRFQSFGPGKWALASQEGLSGGGNTNGVEMS